MSNPVTNGQKQKRSGYILLIGSVMVIVGGVAVFYYYNVPSISYFGLLIPGGLLAFFGFKNVSATNKGATLTDERRSGVVTKAGSYAFWLLLNAIVVDAFIQLTPDEGTRTIYVAVGLASLGIGYVVAKYVDPAFKTHGQ